MPGGITAGADRIIETMQLPAAEAAKRAQDIGAAEARRSERGVNPIPVMAIVIIFFVISLVRTEGIGIWLRRPGSLREVLKAS